VIDRSKTCDDNFQENAGYGDLISDSEEKISHIVLCISILFQKRHICHTRVQMVKKGGRLSNQENDLHATLLWKRLYCSSANI
jgi:hypothetical protein